MVKGGSSKCLTVRIPLKRWTAFFFAGDTQMKLKHIFFVTLLAQVFFFPAFSEQFRFKYTKGEEYRILSTVHESVYYNGIFDHFSEIVNRISVSVTDEKNGTGTHEAVFMTTENAMDDKPEDAEIISGRTITGTFQWGEEYLSVFDRDEYGVYTIDDTYFMPIVRNVPVFPDYDLKPGDTWEYDGEEVHDMRINYGIQEPFHIPFTTEYTYEGTTEKDGKTLHVITADYSLFYDVPVKPDAKGTAPVRAMGYSYQTIYWDSEAGAIHSYEEEFRIVIDTKNGDRIENVGTAGAEYAEKPHFSKEAALQDIQKQLEGLENTEVTIDDKGITLRLENIRFRADSAVLLDSEKQKLEKIADILKAYTENDLLISGYTARAGTEESCIALSKERAAAVADFLVNLGVKDAHHIFTQGFGSSFPIADNSTAEGMARNRRVEITIMH